MAGYEVIGQEELKEIHDVFDNGSVLYRRGFDERRNGCFKVEEFERSFASFMGVSYSLGVTSGTAGLRVALAALGIGPGDEVITQSFTFVATVEAIVEAGASPKCVDIDGTLNMCPEALMRAISPSTKAVIVVHMLGGAARLTEISKICFEKGIYLIEDAAWGCGASLIGQPLGTWGDIGVFSFDYAKTITTGEGGMLVFKDSSIYKKAAAWHDHGHENNPSLARWEDSRTSSGFNFRMMELQGAIGIAQLRKLPSIIEAQSKNKADIWRSIRNIPGVTERELPTGSYETSDALILTLSSATIAKNLRTELLMQGINTKILPEAITWHFAGYWDHIPQLIQAHGENLQNVFEKSFRILNRCVSIPIGVYMDDQLPRKVKSAILTVMD